jgi:Methylamine utilisation protein MauE
MARFFLGAVFTLAGAAKMWRRSEFEHAVARYELIPAGRTRLVAEWLPRFELAAGVLLLTGLGVRAAGVAVAAVLVVFSLAVGINLLRGRSFDCGCLGLGAPRKIGWGLVARNVALAACASVAAAVAPSALALDALLPWSTGQSIAARDALALLLTAVAGALAISLFSHAFHLRRATAGATAS